MLKHLATVSLGGCFRIVPRIPTLRHFSAIRETPHSVVTAHLIDAAGQPTIAARDEILEFFKHRLASGRPRV